MQDKDRVHQAQAMQFASNVSSPTRAKQFQQMQMVDNNEAMNQNMLNERARIAEQYQNRVRDEHK